MTSPSQPTAAVLLAAGAGTRLGRGPKALLEYRQEPLVAHVASVLRDGGCAEIVVVLGAGSDQVRRQADLSGCLVLDNPGWSGGMGSSFRLGAAAVPSGFHMLAALVDQPGVTSAIVRRLRDSHKPGRVTAAAYRGADGELQRGHPVLFDAALVAQAAEAASGDSGARGFLQDHTHLIDLVDCSDESDGGDVDTVADLYRLD
ncbi:nicotine blue oxidoreductase [Crystallibacter degradans]|uniref:nicotine blue oxidoreductase n=1 Tax=Crystallibacter degradans TaxID=2726743 RepID=UPI00197BCDC6|nr:nucleotidyltransferase family protein [Arthrobacter sp. SF27]